MINPEHCPRECEYSKLKAEIERLRAEVDGWKHTALAMRDASIHWERETGPSPRCAEIQNIYFDAAMFGKFTNIYAQQSENKP